MEFTQRDMMRFWSKVGFTANPDKCWEWKAGKVGGYGHFRYGKTHLKAHRVSWEMTNGEIPIGLDICHSCDNPACVNPKHLFPGTRLDNMKDMIAKGRGNHQGGARSRHHVLSAEQVNDIRARWSFRKVTQDQLADEMGVSRSTISRIIHQRSWKEGV